MSNCDMQIIDENQPPAQSQNTSTTTGEDTEVVPKHLRSRYWNSWEEMRLVELWRLHSNEVTTLKTNIPIFRTISEGMREYGFFVNAQEVRRKINSFKNRYIAERRRLEMEEKDKESHWRLYPLIHCLLAPRQKNQLLTHQQLIIERLFAKIPLELINKELPITEMQTTKIIQKPAAFMANSAEQSALPTQLRGQLRYHPYARANGDASFLLRHNFTKERLTQIRVDNSILSDQRDAALKQLKSEERSFRALESFLMNWQKKHEVVLQRLQCTNGN
uniref:Myb/SANT-like DNA-binding domain-containing protein n=1 Tax=Bactrocera dorsalis TaxID=27457 RepID=A0A034WEY2_BACDO